jgi:hypothetical protein
MKFVYFGTPDFSARLLERLMRAGMVPAAVVTNPDRPVGRKKIVTAPPVKRLIQRGAESGERGDRNFAAGKIGCGVHGEIEIIRR